VTAKVARFKVPALEGRPSRRCRVYEIPVSYNGRDYREGKKIGWKDGVQALYCIVRYAYQRLITRRRERSPVEEHDMTRFRLGGLTLAAICCPGAGCPRRKRLAPPPPG